MTVLLAFAAGWADRAWAQALPDAWAVLYLAPAPSPGWGLAAGDRALVHQRAQSLCLARSQGVPCRLALEVPGRCLAIAQAPLAAEDTLRVLFAAGGSGASRAEAEADALTRCRARLGAGACQVAESVCSAAE
jgi:hypothetical protein